MEIRIAPQRMIRRELSITLACQLILVAMLAYWLEASPLVALVAMGVQVTIAGCLLHSVPDDWHRLGWANRVTLARSVLVALLAGTLTDPVVLSRHVGFFAALSLLALMLDGGDGWVARRTGSASELGARFDMELDAFFILLLCLALMVLGKVGAWVVAIGAMRYAFVLAGLGLSFAVDIRWLYRHAAHGTRPIP